MAVTFSPLNINPSPEVANHDISTGGVIVARVIAPEQLDEMYKAMEGSGFRSMGGIEILQRVEDSDSPPRMDLIRKKGLKKSGVAQKLSGITLQNVVSVWQQQPDSPLKDECELTFDTTSVTHDKFGKQFVNVIPALESESRLMADIGCLQNGLSKAAGKPVFLGKIQFGLAVATVDFGEGYTAEAETVAHRIVKTIRPVIQEAAARFAMVGYGVVPLNED